MSLLLKVECYAGYRADERPLRFAFQTKPEERSLEVKQVLDQWYGVGYRCFKVLVDDDNIYILRHDETQDVWTLDSFRRGPGGHGQGFSDRGLFPGSQSHG